ncbi:MAG: nitrous oxide reductase family maturation protein NosD [Candidatus Competibacteraceae bacterium]|nr:nitrous oxide reductase family maturation protein NosD [Candidatus Competibacteraceae bacterium]
MRIFLSYILLICFVQSTYSKTIWVGKNHKFSSITPAIKAAENGDTVIVESGFYKEGNIVIDKSITFLGVGMPIIDGDRKFEVITIRASYVTVKGFQVQHSGYATLDDPGGIKVYNSKHVQILDNYLYDNFFGIYIQQGKHCLIKNNRIIAFGKAEQEIGNGIHCWKSDSLLVIGNHITGNRDGIYFEFVTNSVIWRNVSVNNIRYGLHFMFSHNDAYFTNIFKNNGAGVAVMYTKNVTMMNNTFIENWGDAAYGLLLKEISDSYIYNNRFVNNTSAIFLDGASRIRVEKNLFKSNGWGMKIQANGMDNVVTQNNFIRNTFDISTNGTLVLSTFDGNYWDRYEGYDLDKDRIGDVPYRPLSLFSVIVEINPPAMLLYRSFMVTLLDKSERILPSLTPDNFIDNTPLMRPLPL